MLDGTDSASELAQALFDHEDAKLLLLSATPYKMYSLSHEAAEDDHYKDFLRTVKFLCPTGNRVEQFQGLLKSNYRRALLTLGAGDGSELTDIKREIEAFLRQIMVRTEKLASSEMRDGMLQEVNSGDSLLFQRILLVISVYRSYHACSVNQTHWSIGNHALPDEFYGWL